MFKRISALGLSLCVSFSVCSAVAADPVSNPTTRQLIVRLKDDGVRRVQAAQRNDAVPDIALANGQILKFIRHYDGNGIVVQLPEAVSPEDAQAIARQLASNPYVASAQPDKRMYPALVPNDPEYTSQWYLFEDTAGIRMPEAWDQETGSSLAVIAQLDTGILDHRDLVSARVLGGYDFISNVTKANDGDARDPDPSDPGDAAAADECGPGEPASPSSWHGLSVAGVMVAESDNLADITGIDFAASLLPVRVLGKCGGDLSDVADAIRWAAGLPGNGIPTNPTPARVINLSLSGEGACTQEEQDAIDAAVNAGAVVVVAAGNQGADVADVSPANCDNVVVVGAVARDGSRASYMNTGEEVDLSAPGGDNQDFNSPDGIRVLSNTGIAGPAGDRLRFIQGTSFTTAQVSAVASLMLATNSSLTPQMVQDLLKLTTRDFPDLSCDTSLCGQGLLDATAALAGAANPASVLGATAKTDGGGGCVVRAGWSGIDPLLPTFLLFAGMSVLYRRSGSR